MVSGIVVARRWQVWRACYYAALAGLFGLIALYVGPNYILFGKPTWLTPADFVPEAERECVPVVRAVKEYQRDHGRLPESGRDLVPEYLPAVAHGFTVFNGEAWYNGRFNHAITYRFTPGPEAWSVTGVFVNGPLPLPPVTIGSSNRPSTRPATGPD